jgi:hypothetical protein
MKTPEEFWAMVDQSGGPDAFWPWLGRIIESKGTDPRGQLYWRGRTRLAHQVAYELGVGPIPEGLQVNHQCHMSTCCNPRHLEAGTQKDNMRDMDAAGRRVNPKYRGIVLTPEKVVLIRRHRKLGLHISYLAEVFGVSEVCIQKVVEYRSWTWVVDDREVGL